MGEGLKHFLGERRSFALVLCLKLCEEIVGQRRDVFAAFAQRRQIQCDDVDAIEQILAKAAGGNFVGEIAIGGADDARVGAALLRVADAAVSNPGSPTNTFKTYRGQWLHPNSPP